MEVHELGCILKQMYNGCKYGEKAVMIHLFGIKYAEQIRNNKISIRDIVKIADIKESYIVEINKDINLSRYVEVKSQFK